MKPYVYKKNEPGSWYKETLDLIDNRSRKITLEMICKGANVEKRWLALLIVGKIKDPSVNRIEAINNYLESLKS